jgi:hypothetical protein
MTTKTNAELARDVEAIKVKQDKQDVLHAKIDVILEAVVGQSGKFERALEQFQSVVTNTQITLARVQERVSFQWKVIAGAGGIALVVLGAILGQYLHFLHP